MMASKIYSYWLSSGYEMPSLGLGTWELKGKKCEQTVRDALDLGYRHIDTAELYENEEAIGKAIQDYDRESLFITSKVASSNLAKNDLFEACRRSLKKLGTDYLDLYLIHWPNDNIPIAETLDAMQELVQKGLIRSVGLSNFDAERVRQALSVSSLPICNLQIEYHPLTKRVELPEFCKKEDIIITAYSPLARGKIFSEPELMAIADKYHKSAAQISLKWLLQKGHVVIPKSSSKEHLGKNLEIYDWELAQEDVERINNIQNQERLVDTKYT